MSPSNLLQIDGIPAVLLDRCYNVLYPRITHPEQIGDISHVHLLLKEQPVYILAKFVFRFLRNLSLIFFLHRGGLLFVVLHPFLYHYLYAE